MRGHGLSRLLAGFLCLRVQSVRNIPLLRQKRLKHLDICGNIDSILFIQTV